MVGVLLGVSKNNMIGGNDWEYRERKMWQLKKDASMEI